MAYETILLERKGAVAVVRLNRPDKLNAMNAKLKEEVAQALGRPQSFVAKCESGERRLDVVELADFARLYRKPITFFVPRRRPDATA